MSINILLVEDEVIIAMATKMLLEKHGYKVSIETNAQKAIDRCLDEIDLILMDIDLGSGMTGVQAASVILECNNIPLVFLSSHNEPEIVETTSMVTSYGYILKNSGITVLLASIQMALKLYEAKKKLEEKEKGYREMFESNPHPMWVYEIDTLCILAVNNAAVKIYGYAKEEFLKMRISDFRPQEDIKKLLENVKNVANGLDIAGKWRHQFKNGKVVNVSIISHTIDWMGHRSEVVLSLIEDSDLT